MWHWKSCQNWILNWISKKCLTPITFVISSAPQFGKCHATKGGASVKDLWDCDRNNTASWSHKFNRNHNQSRTALNLLIHHGYNRRSQEKYRTQYTPDTMKDQISHNPDKSTHKSTYHRARTVWDTNFPKHTRWPTKLLNTHSSKCKTLIT